MNSETSKLDRKTFFFANYTVELEINNILNKLDSKLSSVIYVFLSLSYFKKKSLILIVYESTTITGLNNWVTNTGSKINCNGSECNMETETITTALQNHLLDLVTTCINVLSGPQSHSRAPPREVPARARRGFTCGKCRVGSNV